MKTIKEYDLSQAAHYYALANTPLYLIRKLKEDPVVQEITKNFSGDDILQALRESVSVRDSLVEYVRPYAYLVALSLKPDNSFLRAVANVPNTDWLDWFPYMRDVLLQTYSPIVLESVKASPTINPFGSVTKSDASTQQIIVTGS